MSEKRTPPPPADASGQKAIYVTPRLVIYGSLASITSAVGAKSNMDGGAVAGKMKSQ
jgi:hypothetical protein